MGYYTRFELEARLVDASTLEVLYYIPDQEEIIKEFRQTCEYAEYCLEDDGSCREDGKWYGHESDLVTFSKKHPGWLFTMKGKGEEAGDLWVHYAYNGKSQMANAKITYDECRLISV